MFTGDGASGADRRLEDGVQQRMAAVLIGLEDRQVDVAVANVAASGDEGTVDRGQLGHSGEIFGDTRPRDDGVDDVVRARGLGHEERLLPGRDELRPRCRGEHEDVEGAERREERGELLNVLFHPFGVHAFEHDDEIGRRRRPYLFGDAQVEPGAAGDAGHGQDVDVLEDARIDPAAHDVRHRLGHLDQGGEGRQDGGGLGQAWLDLQGDLGGDRQRPLRADQQLREVVPRGDLHELATGAQHGAVGQHDLEAEDVVPRDAVPHGAHAAGVRGDVASEGRTLLAGRDRVDEAQGRQGASSCSNVTPGSTTATWFSVSISLMAFMRSKAMRIPSATGWHPPLRPVPLPRATTGRRARVA